MTAQNGNINHWSRHKQKTPARSAPRTSNNWFQITTTITTSTTTKQHQQFPNSSNTSISSIPCSRRPRSFSDPTSVFCLYDLHSHFPSHILLAILLVAECLMHSRPASYLPPKTHVWNPVRCTRCLTSNTAPLDAGPTGEGMVLAGPWTTFTVGEVAIETESNRSRFGLVVINMHLQLLI